jgi:hypothetical protein
VHIGDGAIVHTKTEQEMGVAAIISRLSFIDCFPFAMLACRGFER